MVLVYTDKMATALKGNTTVAYSVHLVLVSFSKAFWRFLVNQGYTLVGLLPVFSLELSNGRKVARLGIENLLALLRNVYRTDLLPAIYSKYSIRVKLHIVHEARHHILRLLELSSHRGFAVHVSERLW